MSTSISPPSGIQPEVIRALAASTGPHPVPGAEVAQAASLARWFAVYTCANHEKRVADQFAGRGVEHLLPQYEDRKSTRLNSSHSQISYAVFCLKKKKTAS